MQNWRLFLICLICYKTYCYSQKVSYFCPVEFDVIALAEIHPVADAARFSKDVITALILHGKYDKKREGVDF